MSKQSLLTSGAANGVVVFKRTELRFKRQLSCSEWDRLGLRLRELEGAGTARMGGAGSTLANQSGKRYEHECI